MAIQWIAKIGEDDENMWELSAASTDTLPTEKDGKPLTPGSIADIYASKTATPTFKRFLDVDGAGNDWVPFMS